MRSLPVEFLLGEFGRSIFAVRTLVLFTLLALIRRACHGDRSTMSQESRSEMFWFGDVGVRQGFVEAEKYLKLGCQWMGAAEVPCKTQARERPEC